ncbi:hypothetical protein GCM10008941_04360 [Rhizomicrobium palustre]
MDHPSIELARWACHHAQKRHQEDQSHPFKHGSPQNEAERNVARGACEGLKIRKKKSKGEKQGWGAACLHWNLATSPKPAATG